MTTKWTKGPWRFERGKWNVEYSEQGGVARHSLGSIRGGEGATGYDWFIAGIDNAPEEEANAYLIAAAPELYDALARLDELWLEPCFGNVTTGPEDPVAQELYSPRMISVWRAVRAALRKARGDQA